jgi:hypothetical protein
MDFGIFVCSTCSGIHREINHKVKGFAMCNFNDKEIEILTKNGNEVSSLLMRNTRIFHLKKGLHMVFNPLSLCRMRRKL